MKWFFVIWIALISAFGNAQQAPVAADLPFVPSKRWAFVVGASQYPSLGNLTYSASDATEFCKLLVENFRFEEDRITRIIDGGPVPPTTENIKTRLDRALASKSLDRGDLFVLYFSGHGLGTPTGDYLAPGDASIENIEQTGLPVRDVVARIVKAGLKNVLIIADCCRAGSKNEFGAELQALGKKANIAVLLGCEPGSRSYEYPRLGRGAFAHFLFRALQDPTLRDPASGALWASKVAAKTAEQVYSYTVRDYGVNAQRPQPWTEPTQDILLGAYVPASGSELAAQAFRAEAEKLDRDRFAAAMASYADQLYTDAKYAACIEYYKTLEGLSKNPPIGRIQLGVALNSVGRYAEGTRILNEVGHVETNPYYKNLAIIVNEARTITPAQKAKASEFLFESDPTAQTAYYTLLQLKLTAPFAEQLAFVDRALKFPFSPKMLASMAAERAMILGQWKVAQTKFEAALLAEGDYPTQGLIETRLLLLYATNDENQKLFELAGRVVKTSETPELWYLARARILKDAGKRQESINEILEALKTVPADDQLLVALKIAGADGLLIADAVIAAADKNPYGWKAQLAKVIAASMKGGASAGMEFTDETEKYSDDELSVIYASFDTVYAMLRDAFDIGRLPGDQFGQLLLVYSKQLLDQAYRFSNDRDVWWLSLEMGLNAERNLQVAHAYRRYLEPQLLKGSLSPDLLAAYCFAMLAVGDEAAARKALALKSFGSTDLNDGRWVFATYLATQGKVTEARTLVKGLAPVSRPLKPIADGLTAFLAIEAGSKDARSTLALPATHPVAAAFKGMCLARLGRWKEAEPLLTASRDQRGWGFYFVHARALEFLQARMMSTGRAIPWREVAYETSLGQPGNPLYARISYLGKPAPAEFVGTYAFQIGAFDDEMEMHRGGTLTFSVAKTGAVRGTVKHDAKTIPVPLTGTVDPHGNLTTTCALGKIYAKLAPRRVQKESGKLMERGQLFFLLNAKGARTTIIARP